MAYLPINLGIHVILELVALYGLGYWGWTQAPGFWRYALALLLPLAVTVAWVTFRAIEPIKPRHIPVVVQGRVRLIMELAIFALAVSAFIATGRYIGGAVFGFFILFHYLTSIDRVHWLLLPG